MFAKIGEALKHNRKRVVTQETFIDNNLMGAIPQTDVVDPTFLFYLLRTVDIGLANVGTAVPYVKAGTLQRLTFLVPEPVAQRRIASILGAYDDLIETNGQRIALLKDMARGLFEHSCCETTAQVRVLDVASMSYGKNLPKKDLSDDADFPVYGASKIIGRHSSFTHADRTIIVGCRGTVGIFQISEPNSFITNNSFAVVPFDRRDFLWLYYALQKRGMADVVSGSAQPQITLKGAERIEIPSPSEAARRQYGTRASPLLEKTWNLTAASQILATSRDLLLPRLISGQLSVAAAERELLEVA